MNWDAIGAIGEIAGAGAVFVSLVYLAVQVRHNSKSAEDAAFREVFSAVAVHMSALAEDQNAGVVLRGLADFDSLNPTEKYKFDNLFSALVTLVESSFMSHEAEFVSGETMENWGYYLRTRYLRYPGWRSWWGEAKGIYVLQVQRWFDQQVELAEAEPDYWGIL